jgi:anti-sigma regulatory factor (Ser/Thr protein kinase)
MPTTAEAVPATARGFRHEAFLYDGEAEHVDGIAAFAREGLAAGEPVLLALQADRAAAVLDRLGHPDGVSALDMAALGRNPGRIIAAWRDFLDEHPGTAVRGVGEPVWPGRSPAALAEAQLHEELLDVAFADAGRDFVLMCPYDVGALAPAVVDTARRAHPHLREDGDQAPSADYRFPVGRDALTAPLEPVHPDADRVPFADGDLGGLRRLVARWAETAGMDRRRTDVLVLVVNELATNSLRHGAGSGELALWRTPTGLTAEVRDGGRLDDPLVGRRTPDRGEASGRGVWLAHQLCDLVQVRSGDGGTVVRVHLDD